LSRARRGDQRVRDLKGIQMLLTTILATTAGNQAHQKKLYEIQVDAEEERRKDSDGVSTSEKSEQTDVVEEADENPFDVLIA